MLYIGAKALPAEGSPNAVSRAARRALTWVRADEGAPHDILVNALLVGMIESGPGTRRHAAEQRTVTWDP